jgi:hypothetical protein
MSTTIIPLEVQALEKLHELRELLGGYPCSCIGTPFGMCPEGRCEFCDLDRQVRKLQELLQSKN